MIFSCTILVIIIHRISMRREIHRRVRERTKEMKKRSSSNNNNNNNNHEVPNLNQKRPSDSSLRTAASLTISRMRRMSPAFFSWSRRTSTAESATPSLTLQETTLTTNNVWQFHGPKDISPQPPRVRLQPLEPANLHRRPAPLASEEDSDEAKSKSRAVDDVLKYCHTAVV